MSTFKNIEGNIWLHEDLPLLPFPAKPPEWIAPFLVQAYEQGYRDGELHVQEGVREGLSFLIPESD